MSAGPTPEGRTRETRTVESCAAYEGSGGPRQDPLPAWSGVAAELDALALRALAERPDWWRARLLARLLVDPAGCLEWAGPIRGDGYAQVRLPAAVGHDATGRRGRQVYVHRLAWLAWEGPIGAGLVLDHLCRNRRCASPDHLRVTTLRDNTLAPGSLAQAADRAARSRCPRGHRLDAPNLAVDGLRRGRRACLACSRARGWARYRGLPADDPQVVAYAAEQYQRLTAGDLDSLLVVEAGGQLALAVAP